MAYLSSRTNMPAWNKTFCVTKKNDAIKDVQWLLDSNRRYMCALHSQVRYPYNEFVHSIPSYFSKCIITTIRLSGSSQNIRSLFCIRSQSHVGHSVSHVNLLPIKPATTLCVPQSTSYSFASTISTCCSHGLGTMNATLLLRFITLAQALRHPGLYTA